MCGSLHPMIRLEEQEGHLTLPLNCWINEQHHWIPWDPRCTLTRTIRHTPTSFLMDDFVFRLSALIVLLCNIGQIVYSYCKHHKACTMTSPCDTNQCKHKRPTHLHTGNNSRGQVMLIVGVACITPGCVIRSPSNMAVVNIKWNVLMNGLSVRRFGQWMQHVL